MKQFRLPILINGLHSIRHGIEHLDDALKHADADDAGLYDPAQNAARVSKRETAWYIGDPFLMLPRCYGIKFAILQFIHGLELLLKAYLERERPGCTVQRGKAGRSISMRTAVQKVLELRPGLLSADQQALVLRAGEVRNAIEHSEIDASWDTVVRLAIDFLSVTNYLAFALHGLHLHEQFGFDPYRENGDDVGESITTILQNGSDITEQMVSAIAADWASRSPSERLVLCMQCGARGVNVAEDRCVACGAFGESEAGILLDEFARLCSALQSL